MPPSLLRQPELEVWEVRRHEVRNGPVIVQILMIVIYFEINVRTSSTLTRGNG